MARVILLAPEADPARVKAALQGMGVTSTPVASGMGGTRGLVVARLSAAVDDEALASVPGVASVLAPTSGHPLLDAQRGRAVAVGPHVRVGPGEPAALAAGPCAAETELQVHETAALVARSGARILRGGAFKPRSSPHAFQGAGRPALGWLRDAADAHGLALVTEAMAEEHVDAVAEVADAIQVGTRTMQSFGLLRAIGRTGRPVLLKRGLAATLEEWRLAAEHLLVAGAAGVIFCERGLRCADPETRNLLDLGAVAILAHADQLPVIADPSHGTGRRDLVVPMGAAALAAGAHGLLVDVHPDARTARCDGPQALDRAGLAALRGILPTTAATSRAQAVRR